MARSYATGVAQVLLFYRGSSDSQRVEIHPADSDNDVWIQTKNDSMFLKREQARRFARALLEAAGE